MNRLDLPAAQGRYDAPWMNQVIKRLIVWGNQFLSPVAISVYSMNAKDLPTVAQLADLPSGAVYNDGGTLKVKP